MYSGSEKYYDEIYSALDKDYAVEAQKIHEFIQKYKNTDGNALLDVACGTGKHAGFLSEHYKVVGLDLNANMLKVARKNNPEIRFLQGDMRDFEIKRQFDAITCLFSAIGYMKTRSNLQKAVRNMSRHLLPGGVLLIEPWFAPEQWNAGRVSINQAEGPGRKIVRMALAKRKGKISLLEFQYLVGTSKGIEHFSEQLELGLFSQEEYMEAFSRAKLTVIHDPEGIYGRGLYIGIKETVAA